MQDKSNTISMPKENNAPKAPGIAIPPIEGLTQNNTQIGSNEIEQHIDNINPVVADVAPIQPINQSANTNSSTIMPNSEDDIDIQKELEAKFDELFGTIE